MPEMGNPDPKADHVGQMFTAAGQLQSEFDSDLHKNPVLLAADQGMAMRIVVANGFAAIVEQLEKIVNPAFEVQAPQEPKNANQIPKEDL